MRITLFRAKILLKINMASKGATTDFPSANNHPPRFITLPDSLIEPVCRMFVKGLVIENNKAAIFFGCFGPAELSVHSMSSLNGFSTIFGPLSFNASGCIACDR